MDNCHPNVEAVHVTRPAYGPGRPLLTFKKYYFRQTFHQEVKATDAPGATCDSFGRTVTSTGPRTHCLCLA